MEAPDGGTSRYDLVVDATGSARRLDAWLASRLPILSRSRIQALIAEGQVRVDGEAARPSVRLRSGQVVSVVVPPPRQALPQPQKIALRVVYEDERLIVVDKPAGLVVHPGAGVGEGTLVNALLAHVRDLSGIGGVERPGIVHRLDKGTSGLMVVAKDDETHRSLARQFAEREVHKEYLALVLGVPLRQEGTVDLAIGRDPVHRRRMSVRAPRGRSARSKWTRDETFDGAALLHVTILTGRTHQIRVHMASLGHPVAGDALYGGLQCQRSRSPAARAALATLTRPALHAWRLAFRHPGSGAPLSFESPLPPEIECVIRDLRVASHSAVR